MRMRLLEKSEIAKAKAVDRSKEISEGLKISKRVDSLRELAAREEQTLDMVRTRELERMATEFLAAQKKKEELLSQVIELRREMESETNLTKSERKNLEKLKAELENRQRELNDRAEEVNLLEIDIAIVKKEASDALARQKSHEELAKRLNEDSEKDRTLARQALSEADAARELSLRAKKDTEERLALRENSIVERERELSTKESENRELSREITEEKIRLADQRATLERALERIRNNRL